MYYQVSYNNGPNTPTLINNTDQPHFTLRPVLSSQSYFLQVRAVNQWGVSSYSAKVESTATNVIGMFVYKCMCKRGREREGAREGEGEREQEKERERERQRNF